MYSLYNQPPTKPLYRAELAQMVRQCEIIHFLTCLPECCNQNTHARGAHVHTHTHFFVSNVLHNRVHYFVIFMIHNPFICSISSDRDQFTWPTGMMTKAILFQVPNIALSNPRGCKPQAGGAVQNRWSGQPSPVEGAYLRHKDPTVLELCYFKRDNFFNS